MNTQQGEALQVALAYYEAWTNKNIDTAMSYIADDIVCYAPAGRIDGAAAYREFMGPFTQVLKGAKLIAAFGDDAKAVLVYDTETVPVASAPGAECVTVENGKITNSHFIGSGGESGARSRSTRARVDPGCTT